MKRITVILSILLAFSCNTSKKEIKELSDIEIFETPILSLNQANKLADLPLHCINPSYR